MAHNLQIIPQWAVPQKDVEMILSIRDAKPFEGYKLELQFNDGAKKTIDFQSFLSQSQHPSIRTFLQPAKFQSFRIEHGDLVWGDWDLCFPIADLYSGRILP